MSKSRRQSREDALKILYQRDLNSELTAEMAVTYFEKLFSKSKPADEFTKDLVMGVSEKLQFLDETIAKLSENWRPDRMAAVDRNILRLGLYELNFRHDVPATVTINEMVELAKEFGAEHSSAFINGVLDKASKSLNLPQKAP
ncbi:MAG: transcription antitermination factor NusB [Bdellovibrionales bacterium]|nr:transcription antitermination factor NusB [Bdellovibrionales bacterium]